MMTRLRQNLHAFTLTEILVAMGLAAFILVAVGAVFKTSSDTVGTGYALSEAYRSLRSTQTALYNDLVGYDPSGVSTGIVPSASNPFLLIHSEQVTASLNSIDKTNGFTENYRTDILSFFSQGTFLRQTGQTNNGFISDMTPMPNAYIWYGHVNQYNNALTTSNPPGTATWPDNNSYADTFCLGRVAIPMAAATSVGSNYYIWSTNNNQQVYLNSNSNTDLSPFAYNSTLGTNGSGTLGTLFTSTNAGASPAPQLYDLASFPFSAASLAGYQQKVANIETTTNPAYDVNWWQKLLYVGGSNANAVHRFDAYPFIIGPASPASMSMMVPRLQEGCTQFIVEFAGDFVKQSANGSVTGTRTGQDGQVDFFVDTSGVKHIQWYGFPRNLGYPAGPGNGNVYPVSTIAGTAPLPFEKELPAARYTCAFGPVEFDNTAATSTTDGYPNFVGTAATSPAVKPSLIRILVTVTDKNNRLPNGVTQEYIFKVP